MLVHLSDCQKQDATCAHEPWLPIPPQPKAKNAGPRRPCGQPPASLNTALEQAEPHENTEYESAILFDYWQRIHSIEHDNWKWPTRKLEIPNVSERMLLSRNFPIFEKIGTANKTPKFMKPPQPEKQKNRKSKKPARRHTIGNAPGRHDRIPATTGRRIPAAIGSEDHNASMGRTASVTTWSAPPTDWKTSARCDEAVVGRSCPAVPARPAALLAAVRGATASARRAAVSSALTSDHH